MQQEYLSVRTWDSLARWHRSEEESLRCLLAIKCHECRRPAASSPRSSAASREHVHSGRLEGAAIAAGAHGRTGLGSFLAPTTLPRGESPSPHKRKLVSHRSRGQTRDSVAKRPWERSHAIAAYGTLSNRLSRNSRKQRQRDSLLDRFLVVFGSAAIVGKETDACTGRR